MSSFAIGDVVAFRRQVVEACAAPVMRSFRAKVTAVSGSWLFVQEMSGRERVLPARNLLKVARSGAVLELV